MTNTALWLMPLALLPGVALLVLSTSIRYGQIHAEFHHLITKEFVEAQQIADHLLTRSIFFGNALVSLYVSVGFLLFPVSSEVLPPCLPGQLSGSLKFRQKPEFSAYYSLPSNLSGNQLLL